MASLAQPQLIYKLADTYAPYSDDSAPPTYPAAFDYSVSSQSHAQPQPWLLNRNPTSVDASLYPHAQPTPDHLSSYLAPHSIPVVSGGTSMSSAGSMEHLTTPPTPLGGPPMGAAIASGAGIYGASSHSPINGWAPQPHAQPQAGSSYLSQPYDSTSFPSQLPPPPQPSNMSRLPAGATQMLMIDGHALPADPMGRVIGVDQLPPALQARIAAPSFSPHSHAHGMQPQPPTYIHGQMPHPHAPATATAQGATLGQMAPIGPDMSWGGAEVKHRRRTSPHQLQVLERFFAVNPKPDGQVREYLGELLGMSKRNVQVWFQNRRAKLKNQSLKEAEQREQHAKANEIGDVAEEADGADGDEQDDADDGAEASGGESAAEQPSRPSVSTHTSSGTDGLVTARPDEPIVISGGLPGQPGRPEVPQLQVQVHHNAPIVLSPLSVSPPQDQVGNSLGLSRQMSGVSTSSISPNPPHAVLGQATPSPTVQPLSQPQTARPTMSRTGSGLLPSSFNPNLRRVSMAGGDIPHLGAIMAKRQSQSSHNGSVSPNPAPLRTPVSPSSSRRPSLGYKSVAHPYAPPVDNASLASMGAGGRRMSTTLHQHAMRNELVMRSATTGGNSGAAVGRRASMPFVQPLGMSSVTPLSSTGVGAAEGAGAGAAAQLISSNVFSVPRNRRGLSGQPGYLTPTATAPPMGGAGSISQSHSQGSSVSPQGGMGMPEPMDGQAGSNGPLPAPGFSFGSQSQTQHTPQTTCQYADVFGNYNMASSSARPSHPQSQAQTQPQPSEISATDMHMWQMIQARGRLGSLASIGSIGSAGYTTDGDAGSGTESIGWAGMGLGGGHAAAGVGGQTVVEWPGFGGGLGGEENEILRALEGMLSTGGSAPGAGVQAHGQVEGQGMGGSQPGEVPT